ncbi:MAG: hypothetical protein FJW38_19480 [Acidobacteria bacterium]|nr:hypothetical protein [Acidobacteriota bacterium]
MSEPSVECMGVYVVPCDDCRWQEDLDNSYRSLGIFDETAEYRGRVISIALVEVAVSGADSSFDVGEFRQTMERAPNAYAQVAYDEAFLSEDGSTVVEHLQDRASGISGGRITFFLHYYDPTRPIQWSFGEFTCPAPRPMPERLARLVPYQPI